MARPYAVAAYIQPEYLAVQTFISLPDLFESLPALQERSIRAIFISVIYSLEEQLRVEEVILAYPWKGLLHGSPLVIKTRPVDPMVSSHLKHLPYDQRMPSMVQELLDRALSYRHTRPIAIPAKRDTSCVSPKSPSPACFLGLSPASAGSADSGPVRRGSVSLLFQRRDSGHAETSSRRSSVASDAPLSSVDRNLANLESR